MPNLKWTISRLRQMGVTEVGHRVVDAARAVWEGLTVPARWPECPDECTRLLGVESAEQALEEFRQRLFRLGRLNPAARASELVFLQGDPAAQRIVQQAEDVWNHRIVLFGRTLDLGEEIDWNRDLSRDRPIPLNLYSRVDYRDPAVVGEVKFTWELNRHQHLLRLGQAYLLTHGGRYAEEIFTEIESWVQANPPLRGVNWTRPLEIGLRLLAWSWSLAAVSSAEYISAERWLRLLTAAYVQWTFLQRHFSYGSSANNHLLGELLGAAWSGAFLMPKSVADEAVGNALARLFREIERQVHADGVSRELSVYYHSYVLLYGLLGVVLAESLGRTVPLAVLERLEEMGEFLLAVHLGDGAFPSIGDDDGGHVLPLAPDPSLARDSLEFWALLFGKQLNEDLCSPLGLTRWLLGYEGSCEERKTRRPNRVAGAQHEESPGETRPVGPEGASRLHLFPDAGYAIHRVKGSSGPSVLLFDAGPLGDDKLGAHGHADALSLCWTVDGEEILLDPGTYVYDGDREWRDAFRGTPMHNTVTADGRWQSRPGGTFFWLRRAEARLLEAREKDGTVWFVGEHTGYSDIGIRHRRGVLSLAARKLLVVDRLEGEGLHELEQRFHFPDGALLWQPGEQAIEIHLLEHTVRVVPLGWDYRLEAHRMAGPAQGGWMSRRFGERTPALTLVLRYEGPLPAELVTLLVVESKGLEECSGVGSRRPNQPGRSVPPA